MSVPSSSRVCLAERLLQNFHNRWVQDPMFQQTDDSLTSLSWLYNSQALTIGPSAPSPSIPVLDYKDVVSDHDEQGIDSTPQNGDRHVTLPTAGFVPGSTKSAAKPPHSYSTLICMALEQAKDNRLTLADIYAWITNNFECYRMASTTWQNAIRHNLSLNKLFEKVARQPREPGKGSFWRLNPEHSDSMFKKRRLYNGQDSVTVNPSAKRVKQEDHTTSIKVEPCEDTSAVLNLQMDDLPSALTGADFNWNNAQPEERPEENADMNLDTYEVKMTIAGDVTSLSHPPSESISEARLHDLFPNDLVNPIDLSVVGQNLPAHDWWEDNSSFATSMPVFPDQQLYNQSDFEQAIAHFDFDFQNLMEEDTSASLLKNRSFGTPIHVA